MATHDKHESNIRERGARAAADASHATDAPIVVPPAYPSWRYHATEKAQIVNSQVEDDALGSGWSDRPQASNEPLAAPAVQLSAQELAKIQAEADAKADAELRAKDKPKRDAEAKKKADADIAAQSKAGEVADAAADKKFEADKKAQDESDAAANKAAVAQDQAAKKAAKKPASKK